MVVSGVVVWGASLRVEGIGAEGLALQFLGLLFFLILGARVACSGQVPVQSKKVCMGEALCSVQAVMPQVLVVLFLVMFLFLFWGTLFLWRASGLRSDIVVILVED